MTLSMLAPAAATQPASRMPADLLRTPCDLEVIVPAYNEEGRLPATLAAVLSQLSSLQGLTTRVVIVDNGSVDRTTDVANRLARPGGPEVAVIGCSTRGKGAAVRRGIVTSRARMVGFIDADLSVPMHTLKVAVDRVQQGADVVIASRRCTGASYAVKQPVFRRVGSWGFRTLTRGLLPGVSDSQCGFKFFSLAAARRVFNDLDVSGWSFDVEVLMRACQLGYTITEIPVAWSDDNASTFSLMSHAPDIARELVRLHRLSSCLERRAAFSPKTVVPRAALVTDFDRPRKAASA